MEKLLESKNKERSDRLKDLNPESVNYADNIRLIINAPQQQQVEYIAEEITDKAALAFLKRLNEKIARFSCFK